MRNLGRLTASLVFTSLLLAPSGARAQDRLCDPGAEDCREILINHIRAETAGLDVAFWFMEDGWVASEIIARWNAGVPVRVLMDTRANAPNPTNALRLAELAAAGIPMRERFAPGIMHWKMILFAGQGMVEFSGANFSSDAWVPSGAPYTNYVDEAIFFTTKPTVVDTFKTKFDDLWTDTDKYRDYANIAVPLWRVYGTFPADPELNFPPLESYATRAVADYYLETEKMDVIMYRITDRRHTDALIDLKSQGLPIRLFTEPQQYRDPIRLWHSWNVDRLYMAGVQIRDRVHAGLNHQKSVLLYGRGMTIFGSSNWTSPSAHSQEEHNYFTTDPAVFQWLAEQFERKWNNTAGVLESGPFTPLPPGQPTLPSPAPETINVPASNVLLRWDGSPWAHSYDVYVGTDPGALELVGANLQLGPSQWTGDLRSHQLTQALLPGTLYYWRVVGRTMANLTSESPLWTFMTEGEPGPPVPPLPAPWSSADVGAVALPGSAQLDAGTFTLTASGADIWGAADGLHFVSQPVSGDVDIVARVASVEYVHQWTKAGVMIRETLEAGSSQAMMLVSPGKGLAFQRRTAPDGPSVGTSGGLGTAPTWLKLERRGNTITAFMSPDGVGWTLVGSDTFAMGPTALIGLALTSHDNTRLATATFDSVSVTVPGSGPAPNTPPSVVLNSPANGSSFTAPASITVEATASDSDGTVARVEFYAGSTLIGTVTSSPYAVTWTEVAAGTYTLTARAIDNQDAQATSTAVTVTVDAPVGLPAPWASSDIGAVGVAGTASASGGTFTMQGSGADIWGSADALHYMWRQVSGDADIIVRVASAEYVHAWTKAGVMIRETLSAGSPQAMMIVSPGKGLAFQRRVTANGESTSTPGGTGTAPSWVKLERRGNVITAFRSSDGVTWTLVGSDTFTMTPTIYIGLALTSHDNSRLATATFDSLTVSAGSGSPPPNVPPSVALTSPSSGATFTSPATVALAASASDSDGTIAKVDFHLGGTLVGTDTTAPYSVTLSDLAAGTYTLTASATDDDGATTMSAPVTITVSAPVGLPSPWTSGDIGAVALAGSATADSGTFTVAASGADIWDAADGLHYVWSQVSGDMDIIARVASVEYVHAWTKAGVMVRETLSPGSAHAFMLVSPAKGLAFQRRVTAGGVSTNTSGGAGTAPAWVKLERRGSVISAFHSANGTNWTPVGSDTIAMGSTVYVGLALTSHDNTRLATATFQQVAVIPR